MRDAYVSGSPRDVVVQVRHAVDDFLASTTREACVSQIQVVDREGANYAGRYQSASQQIWIQARAHNPLHVTRHELCHAVDLHNGLSASAPDIYTLTREEYPGLLALRPSEGFSFRCRVGGLPIWLLTEHACPDDDPDPTWAWIREETYDLEPEGWLEDGPVWLEMGRRELPEPHGAATRACNGLEDDRLRFSHLDDLGAVFDAVDLWTGDRVAFATAGVVQLDGFRDAPQGWDRLRGHALGHTAIVEAKSYFPSLDVFGLDRIQPERRRMLVHHDGRWRSTPQCWEPLCSFPVGDAIGMAYEDGDTLVWGRWVE